MAKLFGTDLFSFIKDFIKSWYEIWWLKRSIHLTWTLKNWSSLMLLQAKAWSLGFIRLDDKMYNVKAIVKTSSTAVRNTHYGLRTAGRHTYKPLNCHRCQQIVRKSRKCPPASLNHLLATQVRAFALADSLHSLMGGCDILARNIIMLM